MLLEIAATYGVLRFISDVLNSLKGNKFKKVEKAAAEKYGLVPVKNEPGVYQDRETGDRTRMAFDGREFFPSSMTEFEIYVKGRTYNFN